MDAPLKDADGKHGSDRAPAAACARCGHDADYDFDDLWLCLDCYHVAGSTCAGAGRLRAPSDPVC